MDRTIDCSPCLPDILPGLPALPTTPHAFVPSTSGPRGAARRAAAAVSALVRRAVPGMDAPVRAFFGDEPLDPADIRSEFAGGVYGMTSAPRSFRDASRRW